MTIKGGTKLPRQGNAKTDQPAERLALPVTA